MKPSNYNYSLLRSVAATAVALGFSLGANAQSASEKPTPRKRQKPAAKTHKVWTEDNISAVRTPADMLIEAKDSQESDAASKQAAALSETTSSDPAKPARTAPLASAKSVDDADAKIAWEQRDIQGQRETIDRLQQQLATASPDEREHLQKLIEQHKQYMAETQEEMESLIAQKKALQAKPAAGHNQ